MNPANKGRRSFWAAAQFFLIERRATKNVCKTITRAATKKVSKTITAAATKTACKTITVAAACALFFASCGMRTLPPQTEYTFGTVCSINLYQSGTADLYSKLFARLRELNDIFNNYSDSSEITRVNQRAAAEPVAVSQDFYIVLKIALDFARLTDGAFDPTVGPLVRLWGFGKEPRVPSQEEIEAAKKFVGWQNVILDTDQKVAAAQTVRFAKAGIRLDLGAIAKGYAADCLVDILRQQGVKRASISLGGNVYVYGKKPGGSLWSVAIRDPNRPGQNSFLLKTQNATVVTSGAYERFFEQDGKIYGHIFDPATGFPAQSGLASVTIVSQTSMIADALSTSLFVLGMQKIPAIRQSPLAGAFECVVVDERGKTWASKGLKGRLTPLAGQAVEWF